jgi:hypothetical protein
MRKSVMRLKCIAALATATAVFGLGAQAASASAMATSKQVSAWKKVDGTFSGKDFTWTSAVGGMSLSTPVSKLSKACLAFVPAVKDFDTAIEKIGFTGKTATEVASLVKLNNKLVPVLSHITSVKSFESQFEKLFPQYLPIQAALSKDLGIPEADIQV